VRTVPQTKGLRMSLSNCKDTQRLGIRTHARSARFKIGLVFSFFPNKIPAMTQNRAFVKSSSMIRRSERPKMVSFGILKRCNNIILLATGVVARSPVTVTKALSSQEIRRLSDDDMDQFHAPCQITRLGLGLSVLRTRV
jgi:hypothetical protein